MNKRPPDKVMQADRFIEMARAIGCSDDEAEFDKRLRAIATVGTGRDYGKVNGDQGEGDDPKVAAPARKGE